MLQPDNSGGILKTEHDKKIILKMPCYQEIVPDMLSSILSKFSGKFRILQEICNLECGSLDRMHEIACDAIYDLQRDSAGRSTDNRLSFP